MKLSLSIPDVLYELYLAHAKGDEAKVPELLVQQLDRFRRVNPIDRILVVDAHNRAKLEELLPNPLPTIADAKDLLARVDDLAHIEIGGVAVHFAPRDLRAIAHHAEKHSLSVQEAIQFTVDRMKGNFLSYLPEAAAAGAMPTEDVEEPAPAPLSMEPVPPRVRQTPAPAVEEPVGEPAEDPRAIAEDDEGFAMEGHGRLLNPSTGDPKDQKVMPRPPTPRVHAKRVVALATPAELGDEARPAGFGAGSRG